MINLFLGVAASLLADIISFFYKTDQETRAKKAFERRAIIFNKEISPYLLNEVLPNRIPKVAKKLEKIETREGMLVLPYISLISGKSVSLSSQLTSEVKDPQHDEKLLNWMTKELEKKVENNPTFVIQSINRSGEITAGTSDYFSTISSSDIHYLNLVRYFPIKKRKGSYFAYRNKRQTSRWLELLQKVVLKKSFHHYHASIGCSVLTVMMSADGKYKYPIKMNSIKKGSAVMEKHVLPSFMLQPISTRSREQERELDFGINVLREYGEELLGLPELEGAETADVLFKHIESNKYLKKIRKQIDNGKALLEVTGLVLDVFRLRPEITFLLVLKDDCYAKNLKTNWETEAKSLDLIELNDESAFFDLVEDKESPLCAPGLAALINGRERAIEYLKA